uniref:Uncharacterized protein n=1 Tax=Caenorhabditis japonica TaxID=281687 RepID=A0A8R1ES93_CAEJA
MQRRRDLKAYAVNATNYAITQSFRNVRTLHYDVVTAELVNCVDRSKCTVHLKWETLKAYKDMCHAKGTQSDNIPIEELIRESVFFSYCPFANKA